MFGKWVQGVLDFVSPPVFRYSTVVPLGNMASAFDRLAAGEFGPYVSDLTIDNLHWWGPDGRVLGDEEPVTVSFPARDAALRFELTFAGYGENPTPSLL